ncbi:uncharacterized protein [Syngnathus scovelli]|uniref:uncharacterized protein isoform X3 n=1 Tax=Syngnathus scovelli TaxID=161590 RepID=UPI00210F9E0E|nr:ankyrin repeat domain-containing protein 11-like isoform X3 [Syngnathus scovelli]
MTPKARKIHENIRTKASTSRKILPTVKTSLTGKTLTCQDVKRRNRYGETLLHEAVLKGDTQLLKDILKLRVNVNMVDHTGRTALHEAALRNQYEACFCLINAGALVNIATRMKNTPLHEAITFGNKKIVELLLKHGAHSLSKTKEEQTAFGIREKPQVQAAKTKPKVNLLLDSGAEITSKKPTTANNTEMWAQTLVVICNLIMEKMSKMEDIVNQITARLQIQKRTRRKHCLLQARCLWHMPIPACFRVFQ